VSQPKQRIIESLDDLPSDSLSALAEFAEYLRAKALTPRPAAAVESNQSMPLAGMFKGHRFEESDFDAARNDAWKTLGTGKE
jgi:hypothetical protein